MSHEILAALQELLPVLARVGAAASAEHEPLRQVFQECAADAA